MNNSNSKLMRAMVLESPNSPLMLNYAKIPEAEENQLLIKVHACGVCRTDLHIVDGELTEPKLPLIIGHEIVGSVAGIGRGVTKYKIGDRVGVPWLGDRKSVV